MRRPAAVMIAARAPVPRETKTRLGRTIGMEVAATLYRGFLRDLGDRLTIPDAPFDLIWTYSPPECDFRAELAALEIPVHDRVRFLPQDGADWGERQTNLLRWAASSYERTVLIASDSPHLACDVITDALTALERHEVVLGRTVDGGYYLIGTRGFHDVLSGVPMSTKTAADAVAARVAALGLSLAELPATFDVDDAVDLDLLIDVLKRDETLAPATLAALRATRLVPT
jgi:glycosyltransferase A (GT-A) superfamily protein (DUF2064 family)